MNRLFSLALIVAVAGLAAGPAMGALVYDNTNGFANGFDENGFTVSNIGDGAGSVSGFYDYSVADSVSPTSSDTVESINLWLWENNGGTETDILSSLDWAIVNNDGSTQYPFDGSVVAEGVDTAPGTWIQTNFEGDLGTFDVFEESFNITGVPLTFGTQYWLIIGNAVATTGACPAANPIGPNCILWDESDGGSTAYQLTGGSSGAPLALGTGSETFTLSDTAVPEPGSVLLLATGLIGLGLVQRRKNHA
jgi:PEP-CTERM motif